MATTKTISGSVDFPLTERIKNGIAVHGLAWAVKFYSKRLDRFTLRVMMRSAYLGSAA